MQSDPAFSELAALVGVGAGAGMVHLGHGLPPVKPFRPFSPPLTLIASAALFAGVGAAVAPPLKLYDAETATRISLRPLCGRGVQGAALSGRW